MGNSDPIRLQWTCQVSQKFVGDASVNIPTAHALCDSMSAMTTCLVHCDSRCFLVMALCVSVCVCMVCVCHACMYLCVTMCVHMCVDCVHVC